MVTRIDREKSKWCLGKVKFYDAKKEFGFARDLTVADYTENEDDVYIGGDVQASHKLVDDAYIVFQKVPSSRKPGTFKAKDIRLLHDHPDDLGPLIKEVASTSEHEELRSYLESERANWQIGKVKFFDSNKGFGFIQPLKPLDVLDGDDAYVNERNVEAESISDDMYVAFRIVPSRKPGEYQAVGVQSLREFGRPSVSFAEDLAFWMLGGVSLRPNVSVMAHLVPQSDVSGVLDLIEMVAWSNEERSDRKRGTALRLLGNVLEKAVLPSEWTERIWNKYCQEVRSLLDHDVIPGSVASMLWLEGLLPTLEPGLIDTLVDQACQDDWSDQLVDLSYHSYRSRSIRGTKLRDIVRRFSQEDLASWVDRHTEIINEALLTADANAVSLLDKHYEILKALRKEHEREIPEDIDGYVGAVERLVQHCYKQSELSRERAFSLWEDGFLVDIGYSEFVNGYSDCWKKKTRVDLLQHLESEQRRRFAICRTNELLKAWEDSTEERNDTLSQWLEDVQSYSETFESETRDTTTESLRDQCEMVLQQEATEKTQVVLYGKGCLSAVPEEWLLQNASKFDRSDLEPVLEKVDPTIAERILRARLEDLPMIAESDQTSIRGSDFLPVIYTSQESKCYPEARWLLAAAEQTLADARRANFESALVEHVDVPTHVQLYQEGHLDVHPQPRILEYLDGLTVDAIDTGESWVKNGALEVSAFAHTLCTYLQDIQVRNRETARCVQKAARQLVDHAPGRLTLSNLSSETARAVVRLTWWIDDEIDRQEDADFELPLLQEGLSWLSDSDQVKALRKAFYLHAQERVTLTPERLAACSSFQLEEENKRDRNESPPGASPPLGLSAELIIQTIQHAARTGEFPREGYLIQIARHVTRDNPCRRLRIQDIFNRCEGRAELQMRPGKGEVEEVMQNERRLFVISFEYDKQLVANVKRLPRRRYDPNRKVWTVPAENENQREAVFQFARNHDFFINLQDEKHWSNSKHLVETERESCLDDPTYCEGRKAKRKDFGVHDFWWCRNKKCYASCHGRHEESNWESYTLEDFLVLLNLSVDEDLPYETIEMGQYHRFLGWVNRFAQLLDRLYCRECDHILDSTRSSNYAYYRVTHFHCGNKSCAKHGQEVYLHHCFNPKCRSVIDSRDSSQCDNGWWICTNENCGACCSHEEMVKRRDRLIEVGQYVPKGLIRDINEKVGHLERAQHFCYVCGKEMEERRPEHFHCSDGHVRYDLEESEFDRPHRGLTDK
ncbi:cold shock domain-containing protein [Salisaeta longa]|uniref:cold shock domain-containing protein n=1 Tax=Salisaeta longa TaxID=503170 RepID=UPI0003B5F6FF|nr:cold shock domain-containing protein [Salisaeta longa]